MLELRIVSWSNHRGFLKCLSVADGNTVLWSMDCFTENISTLERISIEKIKDNMKPKNALNLLILETKTH